VEDMDDKEKNPPQEPKSDKKLQLDLSEALPQDSADDDEIIELKDEVTPPPMAEETEIDLKDQMHEDMPGDEPAAEKIIGLDALSEETDDPQSVIHLAADLAFEEEDEDEAEIPPLVDEQPLKADASNEVVEITEFDDILFEETNEMITLSDVSEELEPEEEFLELIDVEEDDLTEEDNVPEMDKETEREEIENEIIQFDGPSADVEDVELEDFINDSLGEEIRIDDDFEDDLTSSLGIEAESEINLADQASGTEEFDFNVDSSEISEKIDRLDTIFFDDSESETEFDEDAESDAEAIEAAVSDTGNETENEDIEIADLEPSEEPPPVFGQTGLEVASQEHIEKSIERIIQQNFSGKIESMITEIIEKAVSNEIDRLKKTLLDDGSDDNI
jgi:hypothetical protein